MALGMIETIGLTTALTAMDAAAKCAEVTLLGLDRVIGVGKRISVTLHLGGDVAAVQAAVEAGAQAAAKVGEVVGVRVIPNPHEELDKIFFKYDKSFGSVANRRPAPGREPVPREGGDGDPATDDPPAPDGPPETNGTTPEGGRDRKRRE
jgi:hypothetical protein